MVASNVLRIRLFGPLELKNNRGSVVEPQNRPISWRLLEYLLATPRRDVPLNEIMNSVWLGEKKSPNPNAVAVRLTRLKRELEPLKLQKKSELVQAHDYGSYFILNPLYELRTDAEEFAGLTRRLPAFAADDPDGLDLCARALELFRGPLLTLTPPEPWIDRLRGAYNALFRRLVFDTLQRTETLGDPRVTPLLVDRVLSVLPEDAQVQEKLTAFLAESGMYEQLIGYLLFLAGRGLTAPEREEPEKRKAPAADTVYARLFGRFEIENARGRNRENLEKTSVAWLTLKYMLLHPERKVTCDELSRTVWRGDGGPLTAGNLAARLRRTRALLAPLGLERPDGFLQNDGETVCFHQRYSVRTDAARFLGLMKRRREAPPDDPRGLRLCIEGLRLFRGPMLQYCPRAPWVDAAREAFLAEFRALAADAFDRMKALDDFGALGLLSDRTALLTPEAEEYHEVLLRFMAETGRLAELKEHAARLARAADRSPAYICAPGAVLEPGCQGEGLRESMVMLEQIKKPAWLGRYESVFSEWLASAHLAERCDGW